MEPGNNLISPPNSPYGDIVGEVHDVYALQSLQFKDTCKKCERPTIYDYQFTNHKVVNTITPIHEKRMYQILNLSQIDSEYPKKDNESTRTLHSKEKVIPCLAIKERSCILYK